MPSTVFVAKAGWPFHARPTLAFHDTSIRVAFFALNTVSKNSWKSEK